MWAGRPAPQVQERRSLQAASAATASRPRGRGVAQRESALTKSGASKISVHQPVGDQTSLLATSYEPESAISDQAP